MREIKRFGRFAVFLALGALGLYAISDQNIPSSGSLRDAPGEADFEKSLSEVQKEALSIKGRWATPAEKKDLQKDYPKLKGKRVKITGDCTSRYNCIAWSVGDTSHWAWPGNTETDFDEFYEKNGCLPAPRGTPLTKADIVLWAKDGEPTHACRKLVGKTFESKCGATWRITHGLRDLSSQIYGKPYKGYLCNPDSKKNFFSERVSFGPPMSELEWETYKECLSESGLDPEDCLPRS